MHSSIGTSGNPTALRLLYYPPLPEEAIIKPEQVRCGEHSDYGSITLLFQDSVGGLEVSNSTVLNLWYHIAYHKVPKKLCGERCDTTKCRRQVALQWDQVIMKRQ